VIDAAVASRRLYEPWPCHTAPQLAHAQKRRRTRGDGMKILILTLESDLAIAALAKISHSQVSGQT
jgi:hypothetical protein